MRGYQDVGLVTEPIRRLLDALPGLVVDLGTVAQRQRDGRDGETEFVGEITKGGHFNLFDAEKVDLCQSFFKLLNLKTEIGLT